MNTPRSTPIQNRQSSPDTHGGPSPRGEPGRGQAETPVDTPAGTSGPPREPLLSVEHVKISYQLKDTVVNAVGDVSFEVMPEEKVMLIGPSGCGKSTLLKVVAGFIKPESGHITFGGSTNVDPGPDRAVVFQEFDQLFPWRNVLENVSYPLRVTGRSRAEAAAQAGTFLDMVGLDHAAHRFPHQLSGGMKQRVAIARALSLNPQMLLMDEPFGSLDAITRSRLQKDLNGLATRTRVAMLFVTHSIDEALLLGHRVVVLQGSPSKVAASVDVSEVTGPEDPRYQATRESLEVLLGSSGEEDDGDDGR